MILNSIGKLGLGAHPRIVASITGDTSMSVLANLPREGADIIEVRLDHFPPMDATGLRRKLTELRHIGLPLIATVRSAKEGGAREISDATRLNLYETALETADAVDVELSAEHIYPRVVACAHVARKSVILSYHNFQETPTGGVLDALVREMHDKGADVCKIATHVKTGADMVRLFAVLGRHSQRNLALLGLGPLGKITRVAFPLFGSVLTYGFVDKPLAEGQLHVQQLREQLRLFSA